MARVVSTPPPDEDEWVTPSTRAEVIEELERCGVPLDALPLRACALLELQGVWAPVWMVQQALVWRRSVTKKALNV
jgi:hypothetical protein